jgi:hypothetical protein
MNTPLHAWRVGQKIICVNDAFSPVVLDWCDYLPRAGCVYTIRSIQLGRDGVTRLPSLGFLLEEFVKADFDIEHLRATLDHFGLPRPEFDYSCTCQLAKRVWPKLENHQLATLTAHIGHDFNHHHAQSDAEAAGRVLLAMMKHVNAATPRELLSRAGMEPKRFGP